MEINLCDLNGNCQTAEINEARD